MREHTFEFNGQTVTWRSGTIRDRQQRKTFGRKLFQACGGSENMSIDDQEMALDFIDFITYCTPFEAAWWRDVNASMEDIYTGFAVFMGADGEDFDVFQEAHNAVNAITEKKT